MTSGAGLNLTRKKGQSIVVVHDGHVLEITVTQVSRGVVKINFKGEEFRIMRKEVVLKEALKNKSGPT